MDNKYTGEVALIMGGEEYTIFYDWAALAKLKSAYSEEDLAEVTTGRNVEVLANVLAIGLKNHHPDMTEKKVMKLSPPFVHAVKALDKAITYAYFGPDDAVVPEKKPAKKKTKMK